MRWNDDLHHDERFAFSRELDLSIHGTDGMIRVELAGPDDSDGATYAVSGARRGDSAPSPIIIPPENRGGWRVEEEFINAIRGHRAGIAYKLHRRSEVHAVHRCWERVDEEAANA